MKPDRLIETDLKILRLDKRKSMIIETCHIFDN